jgi:hypothetical protein
MKPTNIAPINKGQFLFLCSVGSPLNEAVVDFIFMRPPL